MHICSERVHHNSFARKCSNYLSHIISQKLMIGIPWVSRLKVTFHTKFLPVAQFLIYVFACVYRLQSQ